MDVGTVQTVTAIIQTVVAFALFAVTVQYVRLTRQLARIADAQLKLTEQSNTVDRHSALMDVCLRVRHFMRLVNSLPRDKPPQGCSIVSHVMWTVDDVRAFIGAASRVCNSNNSTITYLSGDLIWMLRLVELANASQAEAKYDCIPPHSWEEIHFEVYSKLELLEQSLVNSLTEIGNFSNVQH